MATTRWQSSTPDVPFEGMPAFWRQVLGQYFGFPQDPILTAGPASERSRPAVERKRMEEHRIVLEFSVDEMRLINNALNEVCHGVNFSESEFETRLGAPREEAQALLKRLGEELK